MENCFRSPFFEQYGGIFGSGRGLPVSDLVFTAAGQFHEGCAQTFLHAAVGQVQKLWRRRLQDLLVKVDVAECPPGQQLQRKEEKNL